MPKDDLLTAGNRLCERSDSQIELRWRAVDRTAGRFKRNLRPLAMTIDFSAEPAGRPWRAALSWMKDVFNCQQRLVQRPLAEIPARTQYRKDCGRTFSTSTKPASRSTFVGIAMNSGSIGSSANAWSPASLYLDDSVRHRRFGDELVDLGS